MGYFFPRNSHYFFSAMQKSALPKQQFLLDEYCRRVTALTANNQSQLNCARTFQLRNENHVDLIESGEHSLRTREFDRQRIYLAIAESRFDRD